MTDTPKIAKVYIMMKLVKWDWDCMNLPEANVRAKDYYKTEQEAILSAQRFCELIGYECSIVEW